MEKTRFVSELPSETIAGLKKQLIELGFTQEDFDEFYSQRIDAVEDTLQDTDYYVFRDSDNKPFTIVNNRATQPTEYLVVESNNNFKSLCEEVIEVRESKDTNELIVKMYWDTQITKEYFDLTKVKDYYYIDNPDYV